MAERNLEAVRSAEVGDGHLELSHEELNDFVDSLVDNEVGSLVELSLLEVDHHKLSSVEFRAKRHLASGVYPHARSHGDAEVGHGVESKALVEDFRHEVLAEVDDGVLEFALAAWGVANAACSVLLGLLRAAHAEVSHVLSSALQAKLEIGVSVEVSEDVGVNATLAVEAVDVLAHNALENASVLKFNHGHVSPCGSGLLDCRVEGNAVGVRKSLARFLHVILVLILEGGLLPAAWAGLKHSAISRAVVRDSGRSRNSCTGEAAEILALANPLS